jgi:AraC-like DNA-binding protein
MPHESTRPPSLAQARDTADFATQPHGRWVCRRSILYACFDVELRAFAPVGSVGVPDVAACWELADLGIRSDVEPHAVLIDTRGITSLDEAAEGPLFEGVRERWGPLARSVRRTAMIRGGGVLGTFFEGLARTLPAPFPVSVFADGASAIAWLGVERSSAADELAELRRWFSTAPQTIASLRALLESRPGALSLHEAASALGVSSRSLQRHLRAAGATFRDEFRAAQIRAAQKLLIETERKVAQIAMDVGCPSLPHFSSLFRRVTGRPPSVFRNRPGANTQPNGARIFEADGTSVSRLRT